MSTSAAEPPVAYPWRGKPMRVDGREITVSGSLLQPLSRRTNDILRLVLAAVFLAAVITSSLITRNEWVALEKSISEIVGILTPTQSNPVYLVYGIAILALPFVILIGLIVSRGSGNCSGRTRRPRLIAVLALSITGNGIAAPTMALRPIRSSRHACCRSSSTTHGGSRCSPPSSRCRVPGCPRDWRRWWWALLLAFVPIHLVVSAVVPARSLLGPGGRLVRRRADRARGRHPRP